MRNSCAGSVAPVSLLAVVIITVTACGLGVPTPEVVVQTVEVPVTQLVQVTPTANPTAIPTATPQLILAEDFQSGPGEWYEASDATGSSTATDGQLLITVNDPNWSWSTGHPDLDFLNSPFDFTVSMTSETGSRDAYGALQFRFFDLQNYADVSVNGNGFVSAGMFLDGEYVVLVPWTRPPSARAPYILRVVDSGTRVSAYLNGELVFYIPLEELRPGGLSLFVGTFDDAPSSWAFDDITVAEFIPQAIE